MLEPPAFHVHAWVYGMDNGGHLVTHTGASIGEFNGPHPFSAPTGACFKSVSPAVRRPVLSATEADRVGAPGRNDAERNCISNIRPDGLPTTMAAAKLAWLVDAAFGRRLTGVALKDESDVTLPGASPLGELGSR